MKKIILTSLLIAGMMAPSQAQALAPAVPTTVATTASDTTLAVQRLFQKKRTGGVIWMAAGLSGAVRVLLAASENQTDLAQPYAPVVERSANTSGIITGLALMLGCEAVGIGKARRFSLAKQQALVQDLQQGKAVPAAIRRRLKAKHFAQ